MSPEFSEVIVELVNNGEVDVLAIKPRAYYSRGFNPDLPVLRKTPSGYLDEPFWFPVAVRVPRGIENLYLSRGRSSLGELSLSHDGVVDFSGRDIDLVARELP